MLFEMILKNVNIANINLQIYIKILWPQFLMYFLFFYFNFFHKIWPNF